MALPKAPKGRTTSSFHYFTLVWQSWWVQQAVRINGSQLLFFLSFLFYLTVTYHFIFSFSRIKNFTRQRQYPAEQEKPFQCDLKPVGITFCPIEYESENLTKHEEPVLSTHILTHCWFIDAHVFSFYLQVQMLDTPTRSKNREKFFYLREMVNRER